MSEVGPTTVFLSKAEVTEVDERFVLEAIRSGWIAPAGPHLERFEEAIARRVGVAGAVGLASGTAALHLALLTARVGPGRVVAVPSMTFAATANAVAYCGADPVFVDSGMDDGNVDVDLLLSSVSELLREGVDVAAVLSVDLFGRTTDYSVLEPALAAIDVPLIEDAAEALGAEQEGRAAGSFGQAAALSFNGNKILTTSGGGMLLSDDPDVLARARYLATQARQPEIWYEHTEIGYNYRLSNVLAALGLGQLSRLDAMIARRREIRNIYIDALSDIEGLRFLGRDSQRGDREDNCWLTCMVLDDEREMTPGQLIKLLGVAGIEARHLWKPMHLQPAFAHARAFVNGTSEWLFDRGVALPSGSGLSDDEVERVVRCVRLAMGVA